MPDFTVGDSRLGGSSNIGFTATQSDYNSAMNRISGILAAGGSPNIQGRSITDIERGAGRSFTSNEKQQLKNHGYYF